MKAVSFFLSILLLTTAWGGGNVAPVPTPSIKILTPNHQSVWREGKTYTIHWKSSIEGFVCIESGHGGHNSGLINDCKTPASQGYFDWKISNGFISNFGSSETDRAHLLIFSKTDPDIKAWSEDFTIKK